MLVSYRLPHQQHHLHTQDGEIAFTQDHDEDGNASENHAIQQDTPEGG